MAEDGTTIRGIYERNDVAIRKLEGMAENKGFFPLDGVSVPNSTKTQITENGIRYTVDFENGQKTGFFLDQKYNRRAAAALAPESGCWTVLPIPAPLRSMQQKPEPLTFMR